ncbi:hypothetical protein JHW43_007344 [Diplocarpon mali]|nr:hypothetical protein JHW43_007344 [Diplocarpon mali]
MELLGFGRVSGKSLQLSSLKSNDGTQSSHLRSRLGCFVRAQADPGFAVRAGVERIVAGSSLLEYLYLARDAPAMPPTRIRCSQAHGTGPQQRAKSSRTLMEQHCPEDSCVHGLDLRWAAEDADDHIITLKGDREAALPTSRDSSLCTRTKFSLAGRATIPDVDRFCGDDSTRLRPATLDMSSRDEAIGCEALPMDLPLNVIICGCCGPSLLHATRPDRLNLHLSPHRLVGLVLWTHDSFVASAMLSIWAFEAREWSAWSARGMSASSFLSPRLVLLFCCSSVPGVEAQLWWDRSANIKQGQGQSQYLAVATRPPRAGGTDDAFQTFEMDYRAS